jgi:hypothetical protein
MELATNFNKLGARYNLLAELNQWDDRVEVERHLVCGS